MLPLALITPVCCCLVLAQTNAPPKSQEIEIDSDSGYFDGISNLMVYLGHVYVTDHVKAKLHCERLTVNLNGGNPTNIVAETNVVVDVLDESGQTNHITAAKAVYSYSVTSNSVADIVTNEIVTFTGGDPMPRLSMPKGYVLADPLIIDILKKKFEYPGHVEMQFKQPANSRSGTNASSPFDVLKAP